MFIHYTNYAFFREWPFVDIIVEYNNQSKIKRNELMGVNYVESIKIMSHKHCSDDFFYDKRWTCTQISRKESSKLKPCSYYSILKNQLNKISCNIHFRWNKFSSETVIIFFLFYVILIQIWTEFSIICWHFEKVNLHKNPWKILNWHKQYYNIRRALNHFHIHKSNEIWLNKLRIWPMFKYIQIEINISRILLFHISQLCREKEKSWRMKLMQMHTSKYHFNIGIILISRKTFYKNFKWKLLC